MLVWVGCEVGGGGGGGGGGGHEPRSGEQHGAKLKMVAIYNIN